MRLGAQVEDAGAVLTEAWLIRKGGHAQGSGRAGESDSLDAPRPCVHPCHALLRLMA